MMRSLFTEVRSKNSQHNVEEEFVQESYACAEDQQCHGYPVIHVVLAITIDLLLCAMLTRILMTMTGDES